MKINPGVKKEIKRAILGLPALNTKKRFLAEAKIEARKIFKAGAPERKIKRDLKKAGQS